MTKGEVVNLRKGRSISTAPKLILVSAVFAAAVFGQTTPRPQLAEEAYKDIRLLKGMPVDQFLDAMGFFSAATNLNCIDCHGTAAAGDWSLYAQNTPKKTIARQMIVMTQTLNKANFGGGRAVTCYTCHRGAQHPDATPSLVIQNSAPIPDPDEFEVSGTPAPGTPTADEVFGKYLQALGGAAELTKVKSFVLHGDYNGFDTDFEKRQIEIFGKAPNERAFVVHYRGGDSFTTFDGNQGWIAEADKPVPLIQLTTGGLEGIKVDGTTLFPAGIRQLRKDWKVGMTQIDDKDVVVVEGKGDSKTPLKLYFDKSSGLLVRLLRYSQTAVGTVPAQFDFDDYRAVPGTSVKMPWKLTATWVDGRSTTDVSSIDVNPAIPDSTFAKPTLPVKTGAH